MIFRRRHHLLPYRFLNVFLSKLGKRVLISRSRKDPMLTLFCACKLSTTHRCVQIALNAVSIDRGGAI